MDQLQLFETVPVVPRKRTVSASGSPRWAKYSPRAARRPHQCDFCILNCHEDALAPIPRKARYVRKIGDDRLYLCLSHANDQRVVDGLSLLRAT